VQSSGVLMNVSGPEKAWQSTRAPVTVAVLQSFPFVFRVEEDDPPLDAPWADLRKTELQIDPGQTLREVLRRACTDLGVSVDPEFLRSRAAHCKKEGLPIPDADPAAMLVFAAFRQPDDDQVISDDDGIRILARQTHLKATVLLVPDDAGRVVWRRPPFEATMTELMAAEQSGLLEGSARQIYLIPSIPQGDVGLVGAWLEFGEALRLLWKVTEDLSVVGGAMGFFAYVAQVRRRRSHRGLEAIERNARGRGAGPVDVLQFLARSTRRAEDIAQMLGCSDTEAEAIMWTFGYSQGEDGLWSARETCPRS
jgi:hypothetical protein